MILEHLFRNYVLKCLENDQNLVTYLVELCPFYSKWYHQ